MTGPSPDSPPDLAAAYALGALSPDEARRFEAFLATSPEAQREVAEYREVAALLALGGSRGRAVGRRCASGCWRGSAARPQAPYRFAPARAVAGGRGSRSRQLARWPSASAPSAWCPHAAGCLGRRTTCATARSCWPTPSGA